MKYISRRLIPTMIPTWSNRITYWARSRLSNDLEDQIIAGEPLTNYVVNVCSRIFRTPSRPLPLFDLLGEKSGRHLAVAQVRVAAKVYRPIESLLFFVRLCNASMPYKYIWGSRFQSELSFSPTGNWNPPSDRSWGFSRYRCKFSFLFYFYRRNLDDLHSDVDQCDEERDITLIQWLVHRLWIPLNDCAPFIYHLDLKQSKLI